MAVMRWLPLLAVMWSFACGSRTSTNGNGARANVSTRSAGGEGSAGAGSVGTNGGEADSGGSTGFVAGTKPDDGGAAGAPGTCACADPPPCEPGFVLSVDPARCCRCVADCPSVGCVELDCAPGTHPAQEDDECCPSCVADQPLSCDEARSKYRSFRDALVAPYATFQCASDTECARFFEYNRCESTCGTLIATDGSSDIEGALTEFAEQHCTRCPPAVAIPCARPFPPRCVDGTCQ